MCIAEVEQERAEAERIEQGLPPRMTDPAALARVYAFQIKRTRS